MDLPVVLLIDDSDSDWELVRRALAGAGFARGLVRARDGEEALALLSEMRPRTADGRTSLRLVLLDLKLPRISGADVLARIRDDPATRTVPVVVLTSTDSERDVRRAYALGANSFVTKPVEHERLVSTLSHIATYWLVVNRAAPADDG